MQGVLEAVWGNSELRETTVVLIDYDENDGFFDHIPPPVPPCRHPRRIPARNAAGCGRASRRPSGPPTPIGLGPRVPMTVVTPWSRGGWVNSQVFDHTSVLRFLEVWTGVAEPNISDWRRSICGDLMSCFDFTSPNSTIPAFPTRRLCANVLTNSMATCHPPYHPKETGMAETGSGPGTCKATAVPTPCQLRCRGERSPLHSGQRWRSDCAFRHVPSAPAREASVKNIDVSAGGTADGSIPLDESTSSYDVWTHGPNGFLAHAVGDIQSNELGVEATLSLVGTSTHPSLRLSVSNSGTSEATVQVRDRQGQVQVLQIDPDGRSRAPQIRPDRRGSWLV